MERRDLVLVLLLTALAFFTRAWRLDIPPHEYFDEVYYVEAAGKYRTGEADTNTVHPPLGKMQIALGMGVGFLPEAARWRLAGTLVGSAMVAVAYFLGLRLSGGRREAAACAALLLSLDFLHLVQCRIAMLDIHQAFWALLGFAFTWRFAELAVLASPWRWLWAGLAGLAFGASTACKWNGLFAALGGFLIMGFLGRREGFWQRWLGPAAALVLGVGAVYLGAYAPFLAREGGAGWRTLLGYHQMMWSFRQDPEQFTHAYLSEFWSWPLVLRPIWYHFQADGGVRGIVAIGSAVFWWTSPLFLLELAVSAWKGSRPAAFVVAAYVAQWAPWVLAATGGFFYYMLPSVPFMALAAGLVLTDWQQTPGGRLMSWIYLGFVLVFFLLYLPFLVAIPVPRSYFQRLFFLPGWV